MAKSWERKLEKEANDDEDRETAGGGLSNLISIKGRRFTFDSQNLGRELSGIVVDWVYFNTFYAGKYKEDKRSPPDCFAIAAKAEDLKPHKNSSDPQHNRCDGCPMNEWGSGRGRAKACQQRRRLALVHIDDAEDAESFKEANVGFLSTPPTSVKNWADYHKEVKATLGRPYWAVITKLGFDTESDWPSLIFEVDEKIKDADIVEAIKERRSEIRELLMTPFSAQPRKKDDDEDEDKKSKRRAREDDDEDEDDEDEDEEDTKKSKKSKAKKAKPKKSKKDDDDDEDDDDDAADDDDDDEPKRKKKGKKKDEEDDEEDDEDDDDDDEDDDEDDEDEDDEPKRKGKRRKSSDDDDDDDDDDEDDDDDDDEDEDDDDEPKSKGKRKAKEPKRKKGSKFGKKR